MPSTSPRKPRGKQLLTVGRRLTPKPVYLSAEEIQTARRRGIRQGSKAIAATTGSKDLRNDAELLNDMLCNLRFWAVAKGVSFEKESQGAEHHFLVESGARPENYAQL